MSKLFSKPKALLGITLVLCMILSMLPIGILSVSAETWGGDGDVSTFLEGVGSVDNPYQIATGADLEYLRQQVASGVNYKGLYVQLTNDIDLGNHAWTPIGNSSKYFQGHFDGMGHTISGLNVNTSARYAGLFAKTGYGSISNLTVYGTVTQTGNNTVGGIVGELFASSMRNCAFIGDVTGPFRVGGLVGIATLDNGSHTIRNCYATGTVKGTADNASYLNEVGGLVGIAYSASAATITLENCYSAMKVESKESTTPSGFLGKVSNVVTLNITNAFFVGELVGTNGAPIAAAAAGSNVLTNVYYKTESITGEASGLLTGATAYTAAEFKDGTVLALLSANSIRWAQGKDYPVLRVVEEWDGRTTATSFAGGTGDQSNPFQIKTGAQLAYLAQTVNAGTAYNGKYFQLTNSIDLCENAWTPIAVGTSSTGGSNYFQGHFDGMGHTISGLNVNNNSARYIGLFGRVKGGSVSNLTVYGTVKQTSWMNTVGGISGDLTDATITNCAFIGDVSGSTGIHVGGLVGGSGGTWTITNCYTAGTVKSKETVGGLVGNVGGTPRIENCYSAMTVTGTTATNIGGLFGSVPAGVVITNAFFFGTVTSNAPIAGKVPDTFTLTNVYYNADSITGEASGLLNGATAKTAAQFKDGTVLAQLDTDGVKWVQGSDYPVLKKTVLWNGAIATGFAGGTGFANDPYLISTGAELAYLAQTVNAGTDYNGKYFQLMNNIDLGGNKFTPIGGNGDQSKTFQGHFDGMGFTIAGLNVDAGRFAGLFGLVNYGSVKNLTVRGTVKSSSNSVGGITGQLGLGATMTNCAFIGDVTGDWRVGGMVGILSFDGAGVAQQAMSITRCYTSGTVKSNNSSNSQFTGGLVGCYYNSITAEQGNARELVIEDCYSMMTVANGGGLLGPSTGSARSSAEIIIKNAFFAGTVGGANGAPISNADVDIIKEYTLENVFYKTESITGEASGLLNGATAYTAAEFKDGTVAKALGNGWATSKKAGYPVHSTFVAATNALGIEGTSIRTSTPNGLRFHFKVNETAQTANLKEFGVIVAKADNVDTYGLYLGSAKSVDLPAFVKGTDPMFVRQDIEDTKVGGVYDWFTARVDFKENSTNYTTDYSARAYAVYEDDKGQEVVIYSDLIDRERYYTSLYSIAAIALEESAQTGYEDSEKAHLQTIVDAVVEG